MILADTSVWVEHLGAGSLRLQRLLHDEQVLCHPFVIGELACGNLRRHKRVLGLLRALPEARLAEHHEVLHLLDSARLCCAVRNLGDSSEQTAQSVGRVREGRRPAPPGRVPAPEAWVRGEGRALAVFRCKRGGLPRERSGAGVWYPTFRTAEYGRGLGWIDLHLLASALLSGCALWTLDQPLQRAAAALKISA